MINFDLFFVLCQAFIYIAFFMNLFLDVENRFKKSLISVSLFVVTSMVIDYLSIAVIVKMPIIFVILNIIIYFIFEKNLVKSIKYTLLFATMLMLSEVLVTVTLNVLSLWSNSLIELKPELDLSNEKIIIGKCLFTTFFCSISLVWFLLNNSIKLKHKLKILFIILAVSTFQISYFLSIYINNDAIVSYNMSQSSILYCVLSVVIYIACIFDINSSFSENQRELENIFLHQQKEQILLYYQIVNLNKEENNKLQHDLSNQIQCLRNLMDTDINKAKEFIIDIESVFSNTSCVYDTGNLIIDTILTIKENQAKKEGINTDIQIAKLNNNNNNNNNINNIDNIDICNLLTNVLDNAIFANKNVTTKKEITLKIAQKGEYLVIVCSNTFNGEIAVKGDNLLSYKRDYSSYGYGIKILEDIANKYDGSIDINYNNAMFNITLLIKNS